MAADKGATHPKRLRGVKRDAQAITAERVLKEYVPSGSRFKVAGRIAQEF